MRYFTLETLDFQYQSWYLRSNRSAHGFAGSVAYSLEQSAFSPE